MNRIVKVFTFTCIVLCSGIVLAQESPFVGTWKLDLAKSKFAGAPLPESETRTVVPQGDALKVIFDGVGADGNKFSFSYTTTLDGKAQGITGAGVPGGADGYASKRVNTNTYQTTWLRGAKEIGSSRTIVSKDGKVTTITLKATDTTGKPISGVTVFEKQ